MAKMSGARALIESLRREEVHVVFGFPGGFNMPIYDVLYDERSKPEKQIRHILVRHEQSAVHMADGYARASNNVGVCLATSGPGATNLLTGLATAFYDSSPVVAITGQVSRLAVGSDAFQEADIIGMAASITKYAFQPLNVKDIPTTVSSAFRLASSWPRQPVLIDVPRNIQTDEDEIGDVPDSEMKEPNVQSPTKIIPPAKTELNVDKSHLTAATELLGPLLPPDAIVATDIPVTYPARNADPKAQRMSISSRFATMGFAFPAALGAKVARPHAPVIAIEDDVGFLMTENSLATSLEEQIPITLIIIPHPANLNVARLRERFAQRNAAAIANPRIDIVKLAESYGVQGVHVETWDGLGEAVSTAMKSAATTVIDGTKISS